MRFETPLIPGVLLRRYKRFLADVRLEDGREVTAHTANTGSMRTCAEPGSQVWLSHHGDPKRKLAYTWEISQSAGTWVGIHTQRANRLAEEAIAQGAIPSLVGYTHIRREVSYGKNSRVDLLLQAQGHPDCLVEVKNVTLVQAGQALFPDAVTERGARHLEELMLQVAQGNRAVMLFVVQRTDAQTFAPADDIDPHYGKLLRQAKASGVEVLAWDFWVSPEEIRIRQALKLDLP